MKHLRLLRLLLVLPLLWGGTRQACADDISGLLPGKCVRVTSVDELSELAYYVFAAVGYPNAAYLLSSEEYVKSGSKKLKGTLYEGELGEVIEVSSITNLWHVQKSEKEGETDVYSILSCDGSGYVYVPDENKKDLVVNTLKSTFWHFRTGENGLFTLSNSDSSHFFGINKDSKLVNYFGYFSATGSHSNNIYIYKLVTTFDQIPGEATMPADGTNIALSADGKLMGDDMTSVTSEGLLLANGQLAQDESLFMLTAHVASDGTFSFSLPDNTFLDYDLNATSQAAMWHVENGHVTTSESPARYLVYLPKSEIFTTLTSEEATQQNAYSVVLQELEQAPNSSVSTEGMLLLNGGWSAKKLSEIDLSNYSGVSLLDISLPIVGKAFMDDGKNNTIIYVDASSVSYVPDSWRFVVSVDGSAASLLRPVALVDRSPLYVAHSFKAEKGQIGYTRQCADNGNWETLCLPFAADVPSGYDVEMLTVVNRDDLTFSKTSQLTAQQPVIFRKTTSDTSPLTLTNSEDVTLSSASSPNVLGVYYGNYAALSVASAADNIYLLSADGNYFLHAAAGSSLDPFRAYLKLGNKGNSIRIKFDTSDVQPVLSDYSDKACYDLAGRRLSENTQKGVYIINGKKLIK